MWRQCVHCWAHRSHSGRWCHPHAYCCHSRAVHSPARFRLWTGLQQPLLPLHQTQRASLRAPIYEARKEKGGVVSNGRRGAGGVRVLGFVTCVFYLIRAPLSATRGLATTPSDKPLVLGNIFMSSKLNEEV